MISSPNRDFDLFLDLFDPTFASLRETFGQISSGHPRPNLPRHVNLISAGNAMVPAYFFPSRNAAKISTFLLNTALARYLSPDLNLG